LRAIAWIRKALCWIPFLKSWRGERFSDLLMARARGMDLGGLCRVGVAVKNLDRSVEHYRSTFGIGPWDETEADLEIRTGEGEPARARVRAAVASTGPVTLQVIEVLGGGIAMPGERVEGLRNLCFKVRNLEEKIKAFEKEGIKVIQRVRDCTFGGEGDIALLDVTEECGIIIELQEHRPVPLGIRDRPLLERLAARILGKRKDLALEAG
jgi:catechol 2,3-dioxygenase-like lactoylglutathione lyase family enzyme